MNPRKEESPLIHVDIPIVSSYRKEQHVEELKTAALHFKDLGLSTYPDHLQNPIKIDDEFVFFGGSQETFGNNKRRMEIEFLKLINRAKLVYVVATNGYLGRSACIELTYALFRNTPTLLSQPITEFGQEVPEEIKSIIERNQGLLPIIPVKKIRELKRDSLLASLQNKEKPPLLISVISQKNRRSILDSIHSLMKHLEQ